MPDLPTVNLPWDPKVTYVVGHQRPDTDAIASAVGYAWLLGVQGGNAITPARAGHISAQTAFALRRFGVEAPMRLATAAPTFGHAARASTSVAPDAPLQVVIDQFREGARVVPIVGENGRAFGLVTPMMLAQALADAQAAGDIAGVLTRTAGSAVQTVPSYRADEKISDYRRLLLRSETDEFLVVDQFGSYAGLATRARVLEAPRARLILVDHNELSQAVAGAVEAEIVGVLDHHRLGNPPTATPIPFVIDPVGSTSTLVAERAMATGLHPPAALCGLLLSGILSDTLVFRSPTCTPRDIAAGHWLAALAGVDVRDYGEELLHASPGLSGRDPGEVLDADRKAYTIGGDELSIAQVEVPDFEELPEALPGLLEALEARRRNEGLALICLMVTDIVHGSSRLLCQGEPRLLNALPFPRSAEGEWDLGPMVSRKKQLVPALMGLLES